MEVFLRQNGSFMDIERRNGASRGAEIIDQSSGLFLGGKMGDDDCCAAFELVAEQLRQLTGISILVKPCPHNSKLTLTSNTRLHSDDLGLILHAVDELLRNNCLRPDLLAEVGSNHGCIY